MASEFLLRCLLFAKNSPCRIIKGMLRSPLETPVLKVLIERQQVEQRIGELAQDASRRLRWVSLPLFVGLLNGAVQFMMALMDRLPEELLARLDYDFIDVASYQGIGEHRAGRADQRPRRRRGRTGRTRRRWHCRYGPIARFCDSHDRGAATPFAQSMYVAQQTRPQGVSSADRVLWF